MDKKKNYRIPNWTNGEMTADKGQMVLQYMKERCARNNTADAPTVVAYTHGATVVATGYIGGVLNQDGSRIYLVPFNQANQTVWHYINTTTGAVVPYTHGATAVSAAYWGGVLVPNGRIYLIPYGQANKTVWHYIDIDGTVVAYTHGATAVYGAYKGGVLNQNGRIYMTPNVQASATVWHYINASDGTVVPYTHGATLSGTYNGCCLAPNGKIFFIPVTTQSTSTTWHYVDTDGTIKAYSHGLSEPTTFTGLSLGYDGNLYCSRPRIRINPNTLNAEFLSNYGASIASTSCLCSPDGRIYQFTSTTGTTWQYVDIKTNSIVNYSHNIASPVINSYNGGIAIPNGRIYLIPYSQSTATVWHYIQTNVTAGNDFSTNLLTSPYLNKF